MDGKLPAAYSLVHRAGIVTRAGSMRALLKGADRLIPRLATQVLLGAVPRSASS